MCKLGKLLRKPESEKDPKQFKALYNEVLDLTLKAATRLHVGAMLPTVGNAARFEECVEILLEFFFSFCHLTRLKSFQEIYGKLKGLCASCLDNLAVSRKWKKTMVGETERLVEALLSITDLAEFADPLILPFKELPMRKEYVLQILLDAHCCKGDKKYEAVRQSSLYVESFEPWMCLFCLIEIPEEFDNAEIILNYCQSKGFV